MLRPADPRITAYKLRTADRDVTKREATPTVPAHNVSVSQSRRYTRFQRGSCTITEETEETEETQEGVGGGEEGRGGALSNLPLFTVMVLCLKYEFIHDIEFYQYYYQ